MTTETKNKTIKIFISYSHNDENMVKEMEKHLNQLKENWPVEIWRDRSMLGGDNMSQSISSYLDQSHIILLCISAHYLDSDSCKEEMRQSLNAKKRGVTVIPIILSACGWKDSRIKDLLAVPEDGKPINTFDNKDYAYNDVYNQVKKRVEKIDKIKKIEIQQDFRKYLRDPEFLSQSHHNKERVSLEEIFVPPQLKCFDDTREYDDNIISYDDLEKNIFDYANIVIVGKGRSGKTTLCKRLFLSLRELGKIPVYINDKTKELKGSIEKKIEEGFNAQYQNIENIDFKDIIPEIIPIIDDFYYVKTGKQEKIINALEAYPFSILIVDDIYNLNINNKYLLKKYRHFEIQEFLPTFRQKLIKKWGDLTDDQSNNNYQKLDERTELVKDTLGKIIGNGIIPSYPFFILSILISYELWQPLDENITSQGYCYQVLIYAALRKANITNEDIDTYLNFLTVIAHHLFIQNKKELSPEEVNLFIEEYTKTYNLPIKHETLLSHLGSADILVNKLGNTMFSYEYLYFYFVAKYLAEYIDVKVNQKSIDKIISNLHKNENAYIAIFLSHHSKHNYIFEELLINAMCLFDDNSEIQPATLISDEISFFDEVIEEVILPALPSSDETPENIREQSAKMEDKNEVNDSYQDREPINNFEKELRRSIKTVEVIGSVIRNRSGSLEKYKLKELFKNGMEINLRVLSYFFVLIRDKGLQDEIINFIKEGIAKINNFSKYPHDEQQTIARKIFWNLNFGVILCFIDHAVKSLGSRKLIDIINELCDKINTPASFLVQHGILMWYMKNIDIAAFKDKVKEKYFSMTAKQLLTCMVVKHCNFHNISYKDRERICRVLGIKNPASLKGPMTKEDMERILLHNKRDIDNNDIDAEHTRQKLIQQKQISQKKKKRKR